MSSNDGMNEETPLEDTLRHFWKDEKYHDVKLSCSDGAVVGANRCALSLRSEVFSKMLFGHFKKSQTILAKVSSSERVTVHYSGHVVDALVEFIHTDSSDLLAPKSGYMHKHGEKTSEELQEKMSALVSLTAAAHFYNLPKLHKKACNSIVHLLDKMPSLALIVVEAGAADNSALLTAAKRKALTIIRTREGISKEDSTLVANISETALEFFLQDDSETPRKQHLLFEILQHWVGEDEERKTIAKELVHNHICLEKLDPDFLTSSVLPSGFCKTQQLMQAFQIQARAAKEKHGMFARPFTPSRAVWTSSGSITSTCEEFKTDLLKFPPIKDKTVRWTVEILNDAENVWLGIVKAGLDCACFDCLVGPGAGVAYSGKGSVLNSQTHCPKFDTGPKSLSR
ncbi:expressed unknown protein [Seminavis robusta]|uniref:BTB domain-containing protein n=1 Tax=Seminavis robusta TaxID=568900 RepID=A0A9N8H1M5_9STRA|nr:expressed unknown protein [Seminavis robusta]|eukprot:Sro44_g026520.1 n/a (398) ;mRNA; f:28593-29786